MSPVPNSISSPVVAGLAWLGMIASAQAVEPVPATLLAFTGGETRVGVGYDSKDKLRGEVLQVLNGDERSAWLAEGWIGRSAGGLQLDYHWLAAGDGRVDKAFAAWDRNRWNDQKLTIGGGAEYEGLSWGAYGAVALTGRRDLGARLAATSETRLATDAVLGDYLQTFTTTTETRAFERPYDYGVGARLGRFYDEALIRIVAGVDYEWGTASSSQSTVSVGLEKFFYGSPYSLVISASASDRRGDFETSRHDQRIGVYWRYQLGGGSGWRPVKTYRRVETPSVALAPVVPAEAPVVAAEEAVVRSIETVAAEAFFDFGRAALRPDATRVLDDLIARIKGRTLDGKLRITGHTCDIGAAAPNQRLSERRAAAVRDYLVESGAIPAERISAVGKGESAPGYTNAGAEREKNRRCLIEVGIVTETAAASPAAVGAGRSEPPAAPEWRYEEVATPPAWITRAMRNPVEHKREVDTYREEERKVTVTEGARQYLNRSPVATDDRLMWFGSQMPALLNVLANDSDPDGDALQIIAVTNGANGDVSILPGGVLRYMWRLPREGVDHFTYTIADGKGGVATANVTLVVVDP